MREGSSTSPTASTVKLPVLLGSDSPSTSQRGNVSEMMACSMEMEATDAPNNAVLCERIAEKTRLMAKYA